MKPTKSHRLIAVLLALALGALLGYSAGEYEYRNGPALQTPSSGGPVTPVRTFSVMIDYGNGKLSTFRDIPFTEGENLLAAFQRRLAEANIYLASKDYGSLGLLVTKIGEQENGTDNRYWQYWVNNRHPDIGAGSYVLRSGDIVEWKFTSFQGN